MGAEPPRTSSGNNGMILVLGLVSMVLLAVVVILGLLAFGISLPGMGNDESALHEPTEALESSEFAVINSIFENNAAAVEVEVTVVNTSDSPVANQQVLIQCADGGYASAISPLPPLGPGEDTTLRMELVGTGEPGCHDPDISFSSTGTDG